MRDSETGECRTSTGNSPLFILIPLRASNKAKDPPKGEPLALAGDEGFEPPIMGPEPTALPLGQSPITETL